MPKGMVRPFEERIADLENKKAHYQEKIRQFKKRINDLEKESTVLDRHGR